MQKRTVAFTNAAVQYYFDSGLAHLKDIAGPETAILLVDENVYAHIQSKIKKWRVIVLKSGEEYKKQSTVDNVINRLIEMEADRLTTLVGIGGGVTTDLAGYIASIYMRGIRFGFVPTTLLSIVDASIGGKNGIDVGNYKNLVGIIRQPAFILHDLSLLKTLPWHEWRNGFAEIIKHAAIKDLPMFRQLEENTILSYQKKKSLLSDLVKRNVLLKTKVVQQDEFEKGDRKLLNFGHTLGHALENQYKLSHGEAIAIGMVFAGKFSERITGFKNSNRLSELIKKYELPTHLEFDKDKVISILKMDKKKIKNGVYFILLEKIGKASIREITIKQLYEYI